MISKCKKHRIIISPEFWVIVFLIAIFSVVIPGVQAENHTNHSEEKSSPIIGDILKGIHKNTAVVENTEKLRSSAKTLPGAGERPPVWGADVAKIVPLLKRFPAGSGKQANALESNLKAARNISVRTDLVRSGTLTSTTAGKEMQYRFGMNLDAEQVRKAVLKGPQSSEFRERMVNLRERGRSVLAADRQLTKRSLARRRIPVKAELKDSVPRKLQLGPLPDQKTPAKKSFLISREIEALKRKIDASEPTQSREHDLFVLAGKLVGADDWDAAKGIYEEILSTSTNEGAKSAARRNLEVVRLKMAVVAEKDPTRQEVLAMELADLHRDFGHEQAAKRIYRHLAASSNNTKLRSRAMDSLSSKPRPSRLPLLHGRPPAERTDSNPGQANDVRPAGEGKGGDQ